MELAEFQEVLKKKLKPVVIDFWAPWCLPCRTMEPSLKKVEKEFASQVEVARINADESAALLHELKIYGIPTLLVFREGREILRRTGTQSRADLNTLFQAAVSGEAPASLGLSSTERALRLLAGLGLVVAGWFTAQGWVLILAGGLVMFSGVYDRCPIWQTIAPKVAKRLNLGK